MLQNENFKYQERHLANRMTEAGQQPNRQTKKITDTETGKHLKQTSRLAVDKRKQK